MTDTPQPDFDGCRRACRLAGTHTLVHGECEQAPEPEPTVSLSRVYRAADGHPSIGFDTFTVPQLARLIEAAVGDPLRAAAAAHAIVHRNDDPAVPVPPTTHATDRAAVLREAADIADEAVSPDLPRDDRDQGRVDAATDIRRWADHVEQEDLRRMADEAQQQECNHSFPDPFPDPLDRIGNCRHCGISYRDAKAQRLTASMAAEGQPEIEHRDDCSACRHTGADRD